MLFSLLLLIGQLSGRVVSVTDADTIVVRPAELSRVRLGQIRSFRALFSTRKQCDRAGGL
jgi:hypothetical protein